MSVMGPLSQKICYSSAKARQVKNRTSCIRVNQEPQNQVQVLHGKVSHHATDIDSASQAL